MTCVRHTLNLLSAWGMVQYSESMVGKSPRSWDNSTSEYFSALMDTKKEKKTCSFFFTEMVLHFTDL